MSARKVASKVARKVSRHVRTYTTKNRADALKAYHAATNAQGSADAIHMLGPSFRAIARDLGFGQQKYGTAWDARAKRTVLADPRIAKHIDTVFGGKSTRTRKAPSKASNASKVPNTPNTPNVPQITS